MRIKFKPDRIEYVMSTRVDATYGVTLHVVEGVDVYSCPCIGFLMRCRCKHTKIFLRETTGDPLLDLMEITDG